MGRTRWFAVVVIMLVAVVAFTGCKRKRGGRGDNIGGVSGTDIYGEPLGPRGDGTEYASQFTPVYFSYDSSQVNASERAKLEEVSSHLRGQRSVSIIIEGHCDERGSREYNMALGERRALAVRAYLIGLGIDGTRIQTKSFGEERPAGYGHDESAWGQNRRSEFVLFY